MFSFDINFYLFLRSLYPDLASSYFSMFIIFFESFTELLIDLKERQSLHF